MKKTKNMKIIKKPVRRAVKIFSFVLLVTLLTISCKKEEPTCGCDSDTLTTIPDSAKLIGRLSYKKPIDLIGSNYYVNHYWITYVYPDCSTCVRHMILCNDDILGNDFNDVQNLPQGEFVEIKFAGHLKEVCEKKFDIANITYERIVLTSIERQ